MLKLSRSQLILWSARVKPEAQSLKPILDSKKGDLQCLSLHNVTGDGAANAKGFGTLLQAKTRTGSAQRVVLTQSLGAATTHSLAIQTGASPQVLWVSGTGDGATSARGFGTQLRVRIRTESALRVVLTQSLGAATTRSLETQTEA